MNNERKTISVFRVQDKDGRGPWRPGFSKHWVQDRPDHEFLIPWPYEFDVSRMSFLRGKNYGCACRTLEQLRRWFSEGEYLTLMEFGFAAVEMAVDSILAEGPTQVVFQRELPLRFAVKEFKFYE